MKKVNFKKVLIAFVAVLSLIAFSVERAEAQAPNELSSGLYDAAPGNFIGSAEAQNVLLNEMQVIRNQAAPLTPGTPQYQAFLKLGIYYLGIYNELQNGKSVDVAIGRGLASLNDMNGFGSLPRQDLRNLRQGAITLLQ
jgi:hypothetical protein